MLTKLGTISLRIFWETFALLLGLLAGALPVLMIGGLICWNIVDPGCSCFSQKMVLAKVQIENYKYWIMGAAAVGWLGAYLLLRRFKFGVRDFIDLLVAATVFGFTYAIMSSIIKDGPTLTQLAKVPLETLVPMPLQQGFVADKYSQPWYPWYIFFGWLNNWAFVASTATAAIAFFGFGDSFALVSRFLKPAAKPAAPVAE